MAGPPGEGGDCSLRIRLLVGGAIDHEIKLLTTHRLRQRTFLGAIGLDKAHACCLVDFVAAPQRGYRPPGGLQLRHNARTEKAGSADD